MARVKPKRHGVVTDMTAMCDVAFLLLTFFILTTQFKKPDAEQITTPSSVSTQKLDDTNLMTISVTPDGRFFFTPTTTPSERETVLDLMAGEYRVGFSEAQKKAFKNASAIGVAMKQLPSYLDKPEDVRQEIKGISIPMDSVNKELTSWVKYSLQANPQAKLAIKGDAKAQYPQFKALFDGLKEIQFYKFVLITSSE